MLNQESSSYISHKRLCPGHVYLLMTGQSSPAHSFTVTWIHGHHHGTVLALEIGRLFDKLPAYVTAKDVWSFCLCWQVDSGVHGVVHHTRVIVDALVCPVIHAAMK